MLVTMVGRDVEIAGNPDDPYFQSVTANAASFDNLISVARRLRDTEVIFDVGANIGLSAVTLALVRPGARIYAFEPSPINLSYLRRNVAPFPNVTVVSGAVSNAPGTLHVHVADFGAGSHVVGSNHIVPGTIGVEVQAMTLDDFAAEHTIVPGLIKVDVEGHEPEALAGASRILAADRPWVHMEFNTFTLNAFAGHSPAAFAQALWRAYDVEVLDKPKPDVLSFLHDHFVHDRCIADLVMKPKAGAELPSLEEMSYPPSARAAIEAAKCTSGPADRRGA